MPAVLLALFDLIKVGTGIASAVIGTILLMAAFTAFAGSWLAFTVILRSLMAHLDPRLICAMTAFGVINAVKIFVSLITTALGIRLTRFLAVRAAETAKINL